jgi:hypothetical protein
LMRLGENRAISSDGFNVGIIKLQYESPFWDGGCGLSPNRSI